MRRNQKPLFILAVIATFIAGSFLMLHLVSAGDLEPSAPPTSGTMNTLEEIYNIVTDTNTKVTPVPCEPSVEKTGQTTSYATGDDGDLEKGSEWPDLRFTDNDDGTVTDNLTELIWLKNANCFGTRNWTTALTDCNSLSNGSCGLSDGSISGDWRLPNVKELQSLIDFGNYDPPLPTGHPFTGVETTYYWSATTGAAASAYAWCVYMHGGNLDGWDKLGVAYVWPVRGGN